MGSPVIIPCHHRAYTHIKVCVMPLLLLLILL